MAFESLSERLGKAFKNITGKGKLSEKNMNDMLREVRMSLLEADVNYGVVKDFIARVKEKALGTEVMTSLNPGQMVVKIVHDEIVALLGNEEAPINYKKTGITTVMMVGLQGTGKTTAAAKIANVMKKKQSRKPLLVACDVIRPAAIEQLKTLGESIDVEVFSLGVETKALETAQKAMDYAKEQGYDTVVFDTAGRLHIDEELMQELSDIKAFVHPDDILLTVDAMTGQDIVNVASSFHEQLSVTGLVLTKLDGDSRGGGILSVRSITQVPVKFVGLGEKIEDLDVFHPDRMADRILGMGDVVSLVEKVQDVYDEKETMKAMKKMQSGRFGLDDMLDQMHQLKKLGPLSGILKMIPGMPSMPNLNDETTDKRMKETESIIYSMTLEERRDPSIITLSRKQRIAKGCGTDLAAINRLLKQFEQSKQMMKQMSNMDMATGLPKMGGGHFVGGPNRKKVRHKKKKKKS